MTKEDIFRMARECGFVPPEGIFATWDASDEELERFATLVAEQAKAEERAECAWVCEDLDTVNFKNKSWDEGTLDCATAIRARGQA